MRIGRLRQISTEVAGTAIVTPDVLTISATVRGRWHLEGATR